MELAWVLYIVSFIIIVMGLVTSPTK